MLQRGGVHRHKRTKQVYWMLPSVPWFWFTHVSPGLCPVPGPAPPGPDLTVLVAGGASLHLHEAPGEGGDFWGGHVSVKLEEMRRLNIKMCHHHYNLLQS